MGEKELDGEEERKSGRERMGEKDWEGKNRREVGRETGSEINKEGNDDHLLIWVDVASREAFLTDKN